MSQRTVVEDGQTDGVAFSTWEELFFLRILPMHIILERDSTVEEFMSAGEGTEVGAQDWDSFYLLHPQPIVVARFSFRACSLTEKSSASLHPLQSTYRGAKCWQIEHPKGHLWDAPKF